MTKKSRNPNSSGQALIISSLIIAVLLLSTTYYVFEVRRSVTNDEMTTDFNLEAIKLSTTNTMISALANITNGGHIGVLTEDLGKLSSNIQDHFYGGQCLLEFTPLNTSSYDEGTLISWGQNGMGTSSSYVNFAINVSEPTDTYYSEYQTNITTALVLRSTYSNTSTEKTVNVTCQMLNENEPALAKDISMFYQNETSGPWIMVDSSNNLTVNDFSNGTYLISFNVNAQDFLQVSANAHDLRDILVVANATSTEV
jgi:hypothetical protein